MYIFLINITNTPRENEDKFSHTFKNVTQLIPHQPYWMKERRGLRMRWTRTRWRCWLRGLYCGRANRCTDARDPPSCYSDRNHHHHYTTTRTTHQCRDATTQVKRHDNTRHNYHVLYHNKEQPQWHYNYLTAVPRCYHTSSTSRPNTILHQTATKTYNNKSN